MKSVSACLLVVPLCLCSAQVDTSCPRSPAQRLGGASLLQTAHTRVKSETVLFDEEHPTHSSVWYLRRAVHHASNRAGCLQAEDTAFHALDAVKSLESSMLIQVENVSSSASQKALGHANTSAAHSQTLDKTVNDENTASCRNCSKVENDLISKLQEARDLHTTAESLALSLAEAAKRRENSSASFARHHEDFQKIIGELSKLLVTYKSSKSEFDEVVAMAKKLHPTASKAFGAENDKKTHAETEASAQKAYRQASDATHRADKEVVALQSLAKDACAGLELPPLVPLQRCNKFESEDGVARHNLSPAITRAQLAANFELAVVVKPTSAVTKHYSGIFGGNCHAMGLWWSPSSGGHIFNERQCGPHPGHSDITVAPEIGVKYKIQIKRVGNTGTMKVFKGWQAGKDIAWAEVGEKSYNINYAYTAGIQVLGSGHFGSEVFPGKVYCFDFENK